VEYGEQGLMSGMEHGQQITSQKTGHMFYYNMVVKGLSKKQEII